MPVYLETKPFGQHHLYYGHTQYTYGLPDVYCTFCGQGARTEEELQSCVLEEPCDYRECLSLANYRFIINVPGFRGEAYFLCSAHVSRQTGQYGHCAADCGGETDQHDNYWLIDASQIAGRPEIAEPVPICELHLGEAVY